MLLAVSRPVGVVRKLVSHRSTAMGHLRLFLDSSDIEQIVIWQEAGIIEGVTTNPTILARQGITDWRAHMRDLSAKVPSIPISIQVTARDHAGMVGQAVSIAAEIENAVIKIPIVSPENEPNLRTINALAGRGITVNATACLSAGQAVLAAKAGAKFASVLWGRAGDEGADPAAIVAAAARLVPQVSDRAEVLVASIRSTRDITAALLAGAHVVTVPPALLLRWAQHGYSAATAGQFYADSERGGAAQP
jgi:transaldolase